MRTLLTLLVATVPASLACSSGTSTATDAGSLVDTAAATDTAVGDTGAASSDAVAVGDASDPLVRVPPMRLAASAMDRCVGAYRSTAPTAGQNTNYPIDGQMRSFWLMLPPASFTGPRPLFVGFHGTGGTGREFAADSYGKLADFVARGFIVVAPDAVGNGTVWPVWDALRQAADVSAPNFDLDFVDSLIPCVAAYLPVDANRIYAGGHSAGGIMTNYVLERRSSLLAGGIVASGVYDLTQPAMPMALGAMSVLVTWGGTGDMYSGGTSGVRVPTINFVEQASLASRYYAGQPMVGQANCNAPVGHDWLRAINPWMVDFLLAHPKGLDNTTAAPLPPVPAGSGATCTSDPFVSMTSTAIMCPASATTDCHAVCQLLADCAVSNATVGPVLAPQLTSLGFAGTNNRDCGGCVTRCEGLATSAADRTVLTCLRMRQESATCGAGIAGAMPLIDAVNTCCTAHADSPFCVESCRVILGNTVERTFFPTCTAIVH